MTERDDEDLVVIGKIGRPRGVQGEVFVAPRTDFVAERFAAGSVLATDPPESGPLTVAAASDAGGKLVVRFDGVTDRAGADRLHALTLLVPAADRPRLADPDEFYDTDLVGLTARTVGGAELGVVREVRHVGVATYLVLDVAGVERLIPFVAAVVPTVDVAGGLLLVDPPDGLFEL